MEGKLVGDEVGDFVYSAANDNNNASKLVKWSVS